MFCVVCGAEGDTFDGLCKECFIKRGKFVEVPDNVDIVLCAHCGAMLIGNHWEREKDPVTRGVECAIKVSKGVELNPELHIQDEDERNFRVSIGLHIHLREKDIEFYEPFETRVRIKQGTCEECSRERGFYYEAVVQLRAKDRKLTDQEIDEALSNAKNIAAESNSFISKTEKVRGGIDLYIGKVKVGKALSSLLAVRAGASTTETRTLSGRKDGKDLYRWTLLVRLPPFKQGDLIFMDDKIWVVRSFTKNRANLEDITNGTRVSQRMDDIEDLPVINKNGAVREAVVVSDQGDDIQLMHPDNYSTVEVRKPAKYKPGKKELPVVIYEEEIYPYLL